ncbi:PREDICTED: uridine 5'-monophosphate synthase isoform X2 [Dinoponera quadriceps]|uniref:Orotidine 5'-phosphate decarboxylase n=1 Tax=Dinoponera quadriceps TaxID=609295 RepID=A0A6P3XFJ3_DINQU|nr:PREDICTED: uridine 5'-monophosphate synthase isoform X2 [Dinoponera quadriceps]
MEETLKELAVTLYDIQAIKFGAFTTKIGLKTPIYFDLRVIISYPKFMSRLTEILWRPVKDSAENVSQICGVPYTALPLATLISVENNIPLLIKRKEAKSYGTMKLIEDREQGGKKELESHKIKVKSLYTVTTLMTYLLEAGKVTQKVVEDVKNYLKTNQVQNISVQGVPDDRLKLPYCKRAKLARNPLATTLLELMDRKLTNLCLAADLTKTDAILELANLAGPHIAVLKTHVDIVEDFSESFVRQLKELARQHEFLLMEDRKFGDIGNTVTLQYNCGIYRMSTWADLVTMHPVSGKDALYALKNDRDTTEPRGVFLVAEMSSEGALTSGEYLKSAVSMAEEAGDVVVGLVCQSNLSSQPGLLQLTPGVKLSKGGDKLGQRYKDPRSVVNAGADLAVVGRAITEAADKLAAVLQYKKLLWAAYEERTRNLYANT